MPKERTDDPACGKCGYTLLGLSRRGRCPECGNVYDLLAGTGTRKAPSEIERTYFYLRRMRTIFLGLITLSIIACTGLMSAIRYGIHGDWEKPAMIGSVFVLIAVMATVVSYKSERDDG